MTIHRKFTTILRKLVYPSRCPGCDALLYPEEQSIGFCRSCYATVRYIGDQVCVKCGKPLEDNTREQCGDCSRRHHYFVQNRAVYLYQGAIKGAMYRFKYSNRRNYASIFAMDAWNQFGTWLNSLRVDGVVPVPMYAKKERVRGYNQAQVFAAQIAALMDVPLYDRLVVRVRATEPQKQLDDKKRKKNLENAFKIRQSGVKLRKILLIDDIYTTGSTMDEVARSLLAVGVQQVYCLSICIGKGC